MQENRDGVATRIRFNIDRGQVFLDLRVASVDDIVQARGFP